MSGRRWTEEEKVAAAARMRARWRDPAYRAKQAATPHDRRNSLEARAAASARMRKLNERMRSEPELKQKCVRGMKAARRQPDYREMQALAMAETMGRPENREKARQHAAAINRDPKIRKRQWAGRRRKKVLVAPKPNASLSRDAVFLQLLANEVRK